MNRMSDSSSSEIPNSSDAISRQAAIDALHMHLMYRMGTDSNKKRLDEWINNLPSAQPEVAKDINVPNTDTISRQGAIDGLSGHYVERRNLNDWQMGWNNALEWVEDVYLKDLPSVQPKPHYDEWCDDCKEYDKERHCCPRWNRVIRQALKDAQPEPQWIPVSERLPEEPYGCFVTVWDTNPATMDEFENILPYFVGWDGEQWNDADGKQCPFEVIAWMPLPEPYRRGGEDE